VSRIRVLVVDDSVVARMMVVDALAGDSQIEVVGTAADGRMALTRVEQLAPDLVTMDIEMPVMDGIEAVRALRRRGVRLPIIMFTSISAQDAKATFSALAAGATDFVTKPVQMSSSRASVEQMARQLIPRIRALVPTPGPSPATSGTPGAAAAVGVAVEQGEAGIRLAAPLQGPVRPVRVVVMGASMGGPMALSHVFSTMPRLPVPVVLVQHMPPIFTSQFALRLDGLSESTVLESVGGEALKPGHVYVAPGDRHLELVATAQGARTVLRQGPPVNFCRPSVDSLFLSAARVFAGDLMAVVLTGMGSDGRAGCEAVVAAGGTVLAQDKASSLVWGMPGAVAQAGLAHRVLPLEEIGADVFAAIQRAGGVVAAPAGPQ